METSHEQDQARSARRRALTSVPVLAQTAGGTPNTGPQGTGNFVAGQTNREGTPVAGKPEGTGNPVSGQPADKMDKMDKMDKK
jgi:hypothetical protein